MVTRLLATWPRRIVALLLLGVAVGGPLYVSRATAPPPPVPLRTAAAARGSITQTIAVSGTVNPITVYKLSFKNLAGSNVAGKITELLVSVGDLVQKDQPLARIDTTDLKTALAAAQNALDLAQVRYDLLIAGADPRDVADAQRALDRVRTGYDTARNSLRSSGTGLGLDIRGLPTALVASRDQIVKVQAGVQRVSQPVATLQPPNVEYPVGTPEPTANTAKADARTAQNQLNLAQASRDNAQTTHDGLLAVAYGEFGAAYANMASGVTAFDAAVAGGGETAAVSGYFQSALSTYTPASTKLSNAIDTLAGQLTSTQSNLTATMSALQTGGSRYENNLDSARFELAIAQTQLLALQQTLSGAKTKIAAAGTALATISDNIQGTYLSGLSAFQKVTATAKPSDVLSTASTLQSARTALQSASDNLEAATLRAPSTGTIATIVNQIGENVSGTVMTLANVTTLTLRGTIGESEVAKLRIGQVATITVDAVGATASARMTGKLSSIDPVATIQSGVPVYGVDVQLDVPAAGVRAGMSGTADVIIASRQNIVTVPNLAIRSQGSRRFVAVLRDGQAVDTDVVFGISNDTVIEIVSGVSEAQLVVLPAPRSVGSAQPRPGGIPGGGGGVPVLR